MHGREPMAACDAAAAHSHLAAIRSTIPAGRVVQGANCDACGVTKKGQSRRADRVDGWGVSVRLNDGRVLFWCGEEAERQGQA